MTGRSPEDEVLPGNVETGINYYQRRNRFSLFRPGWDPTDLQGATDVKGANNINAEALFDDRSLTHQNIIDDLRLQDRIVQDIRENLLGDPTFALSAALWAPLMLGDTVSDRPLASSDTAYNAEAVPEPGLLLAIGLLGGGLWVTRKTEQ
ncbi:MAG: PEP-CTERM sorting domain-containing protein [Phormidesmis sp.]